jgi:pimeloyl-ACP methyl ester carboxylesterase
VLHGAADPHAPVEEGRAVCESLAGSKEMVVFPTAGHESLLGADRGRWMAAVGRFLAERVRRGSRSTP